MSDENEGGNDENVEEDTTLLASEVAGEVIDLTNRRVPKIIIR